MAKVLHLLIGPESGIMYRRTELKTLVTLHGEPQVTGENRLTEDEVAIIKGTLDLQAKTAGDVMTDIAYVYSLSVDAKLDRKTLTYLVKAGHSRIPVYRGNDRCDVFGLLLAKSLILVDPDDGIPVSDVRIIKLPRVAAKTPLFDMLNRFQEGNSHMALVMETDDEDSKVLGIITLEDVIEELLGEEIIDETDVFVDVKTRMKVARVLNLGVNGISSRVSGFNVSSSNPAAPVDTPSSDTMACGATSDATLKVDSPSPSASKLANAIGIIQKFQPKTKSSTVTPTTTTVDGDARPGSSDIAQKMFMPLSPVLKNGYVKLPSVDHETLDVVPPTEAPLLAEPIVSKKSQKRSKVFTTRKPLTKEDRSHSADAAMMMAGAGGFSISSQTDPIVPETSSEIIPPLDPSLSSTLHRTHSLQEYHSSSVDYNKEDTVIDFSDM